MNYHARCLCGPRASKISVQVIADARSTGRALRDPTGTAALQNKFAAAMDSRWRALKNLVVPAVKTRFGGATAETVTHAAMTGDDPIRAFQTWFDEAMRQTVLGALPYSWTSPYVSQASRMGAERAAKITDTDAATSPRISLLQTLAVSELQGICEAVSQQAVRALARGELSRIPPATVARQIATIIDEVGRRRSRQMISFIVVRAHGAATLDQFRAAGVTAVGTLAERVRTSTSPPQGRPLRDGLTRDAKKKKKWADPDDMVEILTAGDDNVCPECEDISEQGPYTLDEAEALIPAHISCRCAFVPVDDARYEHDEFDPDQPRDNNGMWSSVGGPALKSWRPPQTNEEWKTVAGQDHTINEPPLPNLKRASYSYTDKKTGERKTVQPEDRRLSSGVIMREKDGRTWLLHPTNGFGGYKYTFPKGGVEEGLHPQANAIKETWEETGLKARITGYAGDYKGDTGITRMYHAVREDGHPKDHGWETDHVALANPADLDQMLNRSRDRKIAKHHIIGDSIEVHDDFDPNQPRNEQGEWTSVGGGGSDHKLEAKVESLHSYAIKNKIDYSHYSGEGHGSYGPPETEGKHVVEVDNENEINVINAAAKHGLALTEQPHLSGTKFKVFTVSHAVEAPVKSGEVLSGHADEPLIPAHVDPPGYIDMQDLTKVSGKKGSNEGGVYKSPFDTQYYVKQPKTQDHVANELLAAKLYQLAGVKTLNYTPVKGGAHVATEMETLAKNNVSQLDPYEKLNAQRDFAVHAWLANWDAVGTGGDNIGVRANGDVVTLDTGGSLKYRAQGEAKGTIFGDKVIETNSLRDPGKNPDAAAFYGDMTNQQMVDSIKRVTSIPNHKITEIVVDNGGDIALATQMIARKNDLAKQAIAMSVKSPEATPLNVPVQAKKLAVAVHAATAPEPVFNTKMEHLKHLLLKGATSKEITSKLNWKSLNIPLNASKLGLVLTKTKVNGVLHYKGALPDGAVPEYVPTKVLTKAAPDAPPTVVGKTKVATTEDKPSHVAFQKDLEKANVYSNISPHHSSEHMIQISAPVDNAKAMAEVAKNHPVWKLQPNNVATYSAPKAAFSDQPGNVDKETSIYKAPAEAIPETKSGKIDSLIEAKTLHKILLNKGVTTAQHFSAEEKTPAKEQNTHSYTANDKDEYDKMVKLLNTAGYDTSDTYTANGKDDKKYYGVKIPTGYDATTKTETPKTWQEHIAAAPDLGQLKYNISTPHGNFMQSLHEQGIPFTTKVISTGKPVVNVAASHHELASQVAKYHPLAEGGEGTYFFKPEHIDPSMKGAETGVSVGSKYLATPPGTPVENFKTALKNNNIKFNHIEGDEHHHIEILQGVGGSDMAEAKKIAKLWHPEIEAPITDTSAYFTTPKTASTSAAPPPTVIGKKTPPIPAPAAPTTFPAPTDAELAKAKKNVALQLQYVPGAPDVPEAHALLAEFNKTYAGQTLTTPEELTTKVNAFKTLTANMVPLQTKAQQEAAALANASAAEKAAHAKKLKATQAAAAAAKQAEFEAKINDPAIKAQYDALHSIGASSGPHLDHEYASQIKSLAAKGHHITGADAAYISAYVGHQYDALNENLWKGDNMNLKQSIYAASFEKALNKMPSYAGTAERGVKSPANAFDRYAAAVGGVVTEKGFSSYGATHKLWGQAATIHLVAKDLKDIRTFNNHEGGGELILQKNSMLHIIKVNAKTKEVWAEQVV